MRSARAGILAAGLIAGLAAGGGADAYTMHVLYTFPDGNPTFTGLLRDATGTFYGTAEDGRTGSGYVYKLYQPSPGSHWKLLDIHDFGTDGELGLDLIQDTAGNLYGLTFPSAHGAGRFFELSPPPPGVNKWTESLLAVVPPGDLLIRQLTYAGRSAGLAYDGVSPIYGVMDSPGGAHARGEAFSLAQSGGVWSFADIYDFCSTGKKFCTDGADPSGGLTMDQAGNLYGAARSGGAHHHGVAYELSPNGVGGWSQSVIYSFCAVHFCLDGEEPGDNLLLDTVSGTLYGTTGRGGVRPCREHWERGCEGVVYSLAPDGGGWDFAVLATFCKRVACADGARPFGLARDGSGTLYGVTDVGGIVASNAPWGGGTVFSLNGTPQRLYAFCKQTDCNDGRLPNAALFLDPSGNIFGTTQNGGTYDSGVVFELTP